MDKGFKIHYNPLDNNCGATLIYIMAAFLITSFIGVTMIKQSHHELTSSFDYSSMSTASIAAKSGLLATEKFLIEDENSTIIILNGYIKSPGKKWLLGDSSNLITIDRQLKFSSELLSFSYNTANNSEFYATIKSNGFGQDKSKKSIISTIKLSGLGWFKDSSLNTGEIPLNALHLGGGADELNRALNVHGDTYLYGGGWCYDPLGNTCEFNGIFRTGPSSSTFVLKKSTFYDVAYFEGPLTIGDNNPIFKKAIGFEKKVNLGYGHTFTVDTGGVFMNGGMKDQNCNSLKNNLKNKGPVRGRVGKIYGDYSSTGLNEIFKNYTSSSLETSKMSIADTLGLEAVQKVKLNLSQIRQKAIDIYLNSGGLLPSNATGADMNLLYDDYFNNYPDQLYNSEWLVLKYNGANGNPFSTGGVGFHGKVIWLVEGASMECNSHFYEHDTTSGISFIYVAPGKRIYRIGGCKFFQGFIYTDTDMQCVFAALEGSSFHGGIYCADGKGPFRIEGHVNGAGGKFNVYYKSSVINKLALTGIFTDSTATPIISHTDSLILTCSIETSLLGLHY